MPDRGKKDAVYKKTYLQFDGSFARSHLGVKLLARSRSHVGGGRVVPVPELVKLQILRALNRVPSEKQNLIKLGLRQTSWTNTIQRGRS